MKTATARARSNIALVKYWGKADPQLNIPATGSISMTLTSLVTTTSVTFDDGCQRDQVRLDGADAPERARLRVIQILDRVRKLHGIRDHARVESSNSFPTAAGLASSASGFAALAASASSAAGLDLKMDELSDLARRGSGSAPRSLLGGFVELAPDEPACAIQQLAPPEHWDIRLVMALTDRREKPVGSTEGMERSRLTSPYYPSWIASHPDDLASARRAIQDRNFEELGRIAESSCFKMHAVAMSSQPPILYFNPASIAVIHRVWQLRKEGLVGYLTLDAGPQVKVLCQAACAPDFARELASLDGVVQVLVEQPGPGVELLA